MGLGDELMVTGRARVMQLKDPRKVRVMHLRHGQRWHELWAGNPRIAQADDHDSDCQPLLDCPGCRPYIAEKHIDHWVWREYGPAPGELYFSKTERHVAAGMDPGVIIEPRIKEAASPNKQWGEQRWADFIGRCGRQGIKLSMFGGTPMEGVTLITVASFRQACAILARAKAYVGHEGGLHHAAAAVGARAIVLFGGFISPAVTGYASQVSLYAPHPKYPLGCGMRGECDHCAAAMASIQPADVLALLEHFL